MFNGTLCSPPSQEAFSPDKRRFTRSLVNGTAVPVSNKATVPAASAKLDADEKRLMDKLKTCNISSSKGGISMQLYLKSHRTMLHLARLILKALKKSSSLSTAVDEVWQYVSTSDLYPIFKFALRMDQTKLDAQSRLTEGDGLCGYRSDYQSEKKHMHLQSTDPKLWISDEREPFLTWLWNRFEAAVSYKGEVDCSVAIKKAYEVVKVFVEETSIGEKPVTIPTIGQQSGGWYSANWDSAFDLTFPFMRLEKGDDNGTAKIAGYNNISYPDLFYMASERNYIYNDGMHYFLVDGDVTDQTNITEAVIDVIKNLVSNILNDKELSLSLAKQSDNSDECCASYAENTSVQAFKNMTTTGKRTPAMLS